MPLDRFRSVYRIDFRNGRAELHHGSPPPGFVGACDDIARLHHIPRGEVECLGQGRHARLRFSKDFPERGRQAVRNSWTPPTGPGSSGGRRASG